MFRNIATLSVRRSAILFKLRSKTSCLYVSRIYYPGHIVIFSVSEGICYDIFIYAYTCTDIFIHTCTHTHVYICLCLYIYIYMCVCVCVCVCERIGLVGRVFANGRGDLGSIPGRVIPKTLKMVLDTSLLNTQQYKVRFNGKVEQSRERCSAFLYNSV